MSTIGQTFPYQAADLNQDGDQAWGPLERAVLSSLIDTVQQAVNVDGLDINGNLDLQGHGLINAAFVQFILSGDAGLLRQQWVDANGDLWYRDGANRTVQVTSGGALAIGASTGGFAGDYISTNPSGATYDNSSGKFSFTAPSPVGQSAIINGGPIQLRQGTDTDYVGLAVPASLPGTYTLTFPSVLTGNGQVITVDATGGLNYSSAPVLSGTFGAAGAFRVTGSVQATQTGSFAVVMATRDTLYATPQTLIAPAAFWSCSSPAFVDNTVDPPAVTLSTSGKNSFCPINVRVGDRIDGYTWYINKGTAAGKVVGQLSRADNAGTVTAVGGASTTSTSIAIQTLTSSSIDHVVLANNQYYFSVTGCGTTGDKVMFATFQIVRPTGSV